MKKIDIKNKKASFEYEFIEKFTAGLQLQGTEIKSIRMGKASIGEAYCAFNYKDELQVLNMNISEYENGGFVNHPPRRPRNLLLKKRELEKLHKRLKDKGLTIIPTRLFISESGYAKLVIVLARGKKLYDKREDMKQKDDKRRIDRAMKV